MAEIANAACLLVADIDRGGVFASVIGTFSLLEPAERARFCGFLINKFRGDLGLFTSGVDYLERKLDQPCLGVIPYLHNHGIDDEDSVSLERRAVKAPSANEEKLTVCVVGFLYLANFTDFTALEQQPDVVVYYTRRSDEARLADVLILPGSKNTISDLLWLKQNGWTTAIEDHVAAGKPLLGVCGGFQMLGTEISDPYHTEGDVTVAQGLGALNLKTVLAREKVTRQAVASFCHSPFLTESRDNPVFRGYEIHLGETSLGEGVKPLFRLQRAGDDEVRCDGAVARDGRILGTYLHGLFDSVDGLRWILNHWRQLCGKEPLREVVDPKAERERRYDALADHFRQHLNLELIYRALRERRQ
jgi:adenosylcobyric acid synthase